ncbi:hypothetical protein SEUCBS139899_005538 [Sporothrix eucalyptigena]
MPTVKNDDNLGNAEIWEDSAMPNKEDIDNKGDQVIGNQTDAHISLRDAFKYYKSAILWSVIISNRIIMESYDLILMNHLYAFPAFQSTFGEQKNATRSARRATWEKARRGRLTGRKTMKNKSMRGAGVWRTKGAS